MLFYYTCSEDDACLFMCKQFILDKAKFKFYIDNIFYGFSVIHPRKYAEAEMFKETCVILYNDMKYYCSLFCEDN